MKKGTLLWCNKSGCSAYFTVEAVLILPLIISAMLMGIYLFCYQYDRCLLEQDIGSLMLWCSGEMQSNTGEASELEDRIRAHSKEIYREKYAAWELTTVDVGLKQDSISVRGQGQLIFPVPGWNLWNDSNLWEAGVEYKCHRLSPVFYIRQFRRLEDLFQNG